MKKYKVIIENATLEHAKKFYGDEPRKSFRGYSALIDGMVVGMGGLAYESGKIVLFSDMKEELRPFKKTILKSVYILKDMVEKTRHPIVAIASNKEKYSERLLTMLGFSPSGKEVSEGKVYWRFPNG